MNNCDDAKCLNQVMSKPSDVALTRNFETRWILCILNNWQAHLLVEVVQLAHEFQLSIQASQFLLHGLALSCPSTQDSVQSQGVFVLLVQWLLQAPPQLLNLTVQLCIFLLQSHFPGVQMVDVSGQLCGILPFCLQVCGSVLWICFRTWRGHREASVVGDSLWIEGCLTGGVVAIPGSACLRDSAGPCTGITCWEVRRGSACSPGPALYGDWWV